MAGTRMRAGAIPGPFLFAMKRIHTHCKDVVDIRTRFLPFANITIAKMCVPASRCMRIRSNQFAGFALQVHDAGFPSPR